LIAAPVPGYWHLLSLPGASVLVLPLLVCAAWWLTHDSADGARAARRWLLAAAGAVAVVITSKVAFYGWGTGIRGWNLTSVSGHTVLALLLWPALLGLLIPTEQRARRRLAIGAGVLLGLACGLSRLMLHAHPPSEVIAGVVLGGLAAACVLQALRGQHLPLPRTTSAAGLVAIVGLLLAILPLNLPSERWFATTGAYLAGRDKPVQRKAWLLEGQHASMAGGIK